MKMEETPVSKVELLNGATHKVGDHMHGGVVTSIWVKTNEYPDHSEMVIAINVGDRIAVRYWNWPAAVTYVSQYINKGVSNGE